LDSFGKPIIAKISGYCLGGGALLALKADIRICSEDSTFSIPAAKLGVGLRIDSVESVLQVLGASWTAEVLFSARRLDAREAQAAGLVSRVVSTDRLGREVDQLAFAIAANSPLAIRASKVALRELRKPLSQRDVQFVEDLVAVCRESEDHAEGKRAFAEKREPHFRGC
jgi:enoyl-CoA hydratase/carnithine racemase